MTLVIFSKKNNIIHACADMKLSWRKDLNTPDHIENWSPKVIILRDDLLVCWAGELVFAQNALLKVWERRHTISCEELKDSLFSDHLESITNNNPTDFITSDLSGNSFKISDRNISEIPDNAIDYLGDEDLFSRYLKADHNLRDRAENDHVILSIFRLGDPNCDENNDLSLITKIHGKMINSSEMYDNNSTLGHVTTPVTGIPSEGFKYHMHLLIDTPSYPPRNTGEWEPVNLGDIQMGSYAYQITSLDTDGHQIIVYENLYNKKKYIFGDFSDGIPKHNCKETILPP